MRLGLSLALVAACFALDRDVGFLMSRDLNTAANGLLKCYVGIVTDYNTTSIGTEVLCNGVCGSISSTAGGYNFTTYNCFPQSFCDTVNLTMNSCATLTLDRDLTGCCCNTDNCNVAGTNINTTIPIASPEQPIACYSGIGINGVMQFGSDWIACQGDCMSLTINSTMNGNPMVASIYACDPTSVCTALGIENRCHHIEPAVRGCCCTSDACINPTMDPPKEPRGPLSCYVGLYSKAANISAGQEVFCDGKCASLSSTVAGGDIVVFECTQSAVCQALGLYNDCQTITADRDITGCCCDNVNNCNAANYSLGSPRPRWEGDFPVACFNGIRVNGNFVAPPSWSACFGDCASVMINTTMAMGPMSAEIFTCDPASVCNQLGMVNNCTTVEPGVSGCCCSYDACLDPTKYPNKYPGSPLMCYVGFQSTYNGGMSVGSEVYCDGMCGALNTLVNGENVTTYMCTPRQICRQLELWDEWKRLPLDREVNALCCDNFNNCNVRDPTVNTSQPVRRRPEFPITCFSGIQVNGQWITMAGWQSCNGDCASINITTAAMGLSHVLTLYTCDPTAVCASLNMTNTCAPVEPGVSGCCCNTNGCIDPTKYPPKTPANKLQCYVGLYAAKANVNVGAEVYCSGKCAALTGTVNGDDVTSFHCVPNSICRSLELDDACMRIPGDRDVRACCCDNVNSCNVYIANKTDIVIPQPSPIMEYPISCWNGIYLNGAPLTEVGFQNCNGQCASITLNTTYNGAMQSASIYGCDPTSVCKALS
ncbi:ET module [Oesophagostomum dentatum]|uniref:ET module n=1 Tax=Oesophagostomum dentatum TaxID=61180 RepID=A0A0B1TE91_OESDE|nr:ET module [Oesophagostomum dentatum]